MESCLASFEVSLRRRALHMCYCPYLAKLVLVVYWMEDDDAVNLTSEKHNPYAQISHLHKRRKQKDLAEGTGMVPAKHPPKVKLEIFSQL